MGISYTERIGKIFEGRNGGAFHFGISELCDFIDLRMGQHLPSEFLKRELMGVISNSYNLNDSKNSDKKAAYDFVYLDVKDQIDVRKYVECTHESGAKFDIDLYNNVLVWDFDGNRRLGSLLFGNTVYNDELVRTIAGVTNFNKRRNSYSSPIVLETSIIGSDDPNTLKKVFELSEREKALLGGCYDCSYCKGKVLGATFNRSAQIGVLNMYSICDSCLGKYKKPIDYQERPNGFEIFGS